MVREPPIRQSVSFEDFLEFEAHSQVRHEFVDGKLFVMAGGTERHNLLALLLSGLLLPAALAKQHFVFAMDMLLETPTGKGYYPDIMVLSDRSLDSIRVKRSPKVIIEVLSESTEAIDRGEKWQRYRQIPSLEQYVLLSQNEPLAEVFVRHTALGWQYQPLGEADLLEISCLELQISLRDLYAKLPVA